jgi:hypothetical protein
MGRRLRRQENGEMEACTIAYSEQQCPLLRLARAAAPLDAPIRQKREIAENFPTGLRHFRENAAVRCLTAARTGHSARFRSMVIQTVKLIATRLIVTVPPPK